MGKINFLSETTINKIAAGEVVERPASIVKELIENSLDAGAKKIVIKLKSGGKKHILVQDDGCGMSREDLFASLKRHATSKLSDINDLFTISTMGFRGEAIPSIAAVTLFTISSATTQGDGFKISVKDGSVFSNLPVSMPQGTEIVADDLFYNLPPRKKFLKSDEREYAIARETILKFTVIHPEVSFFLSHNSRSIFSILGTHSIHERISAIWKVPRSSIGTAVVVNGPLRMSVFIPDPMESVPLISVVSVNKRIVKDRVVTNAIYKTFRETIGGEFKSPIVLFIEIDPKLIDVNVHPSKLEIRFQNPMLIANTVRTVIVNALESLRKPTNLFSNAEHRINLERDQTKLQRLSSELKQDVQRETEIVPVKVVLKGNLIHGKVSQAEEIQKAFGPQNGKAGEQLFLSDEVLGMHYFDENLNQTEAQSEKHENIFGMQIEEYRKVGLLFGVYLVIETKEKVIFLDQHAAHERIVFTALKKAASLKSGLSQLLVVPTLIRLSSFEIEIFQENINNFNKLGFLIDKFDESSVMLRAIPAIGFDVNWEKAIKEMLGQLSQYGNSSEVEEQFTAHLAQLACKAAVKRNDILSDIEIDALIDSINKSEVLTCPHGRPFFFVMTKNEFEKKVQRR